MSHSYGAIKHKASNRIFHIEFNGTVDVCLSNLYNTIEEVEQNWRNQKWKGCIHQPIRAEEVELAVTYGGGWYWTAFICSECMVITDRFTPFDDNDTYRAFNGLPEWYPNREKFLL